MKQWMRCAGFSMLLFQVFDLGKGRGVIAKFDKTSFDEYQIFSRIGEGSIGGKARGLAFHKPDN